MSIKRVVPRGGKRGYFLAYVGEKELGEQAIEADKEVFRSGWGPLVLLNFVPKSPHKMKVGLFMTDNKVALAGGEEFTDLCISVVSFSDGEIGLNGGEVSAEGKVVSEARNTRMSSHIKVVADIKKAVVSYMVERETECMRATISGTEPIREVLEREDGSILIVTARGNFVLLNPEEEEVRKALAPRPEPARASSSSPSPTSSVSRRPAQT
jgi:hypothetical protein